MLELFIALSAGLISFLSPCVLPLIPGYVSYISGSSLNELLESKKTNIFPINKHPEGKKASAGRQSSEEQRD